MFIVLTLVHVSIFVQSVTAVPTSTEINAQHNESCGAKLDDAPRCKSIRYYYSTLWMMLLCSEEGEDEKQPCPRAIHKKICEASGSPPGLSCVFQVQTIPFEHHRMTKHGQGTRTRFAYNWDTHGFKWDLWSSGPAFYTKSLVSRSSVAAVETDDLPLTMSECGILTVRVVNENTGTPISIDWLNFLPFPCRNQSEKFGFVYTINWEGDTTTNVSDDTGKPVVTQVMMAFSFVDVKYSDGENLCFNGDTTSATNCQDSPVQLQKTTWWRNGFEKGTAEASNRWDGGQLHRRFPDSITANHVRPDLVADPRARCQGASYLYGVLGAELICNGSCADSGTGECTDQAIYNVCQDGWRSQKHCDFIIEAETLPYLARNITNMVSWNLPDDQNPAPYMNRHSQKQYIRLVHEPAIMDFGVEDTDCFSLRVKIYDDDEGGRALSAVKILRPPVPSSYSDPKLLSPIPAEDASIRSNPKQCVSEYGRSPDGFAWIKVYFFILPLFVNTKQGLWNCWQPNSPLSEYVSCENGGVFLDSSSPHWWSEVTEFSKNNFPKKEPSKVCIQFDGTVASPEFNCK